MTILDNSNEFKAEFQTATLWMIFITTFVCGGTIKAAVKILNIEKQDTDVKQKICENVNEKCIDHMMAGIDTIVGHKISNYRILNFIITFEDKYVKRILIKKDAEHSLTLKLQKLSLDEHYARLYGPNMLVTQDKIQDFLGEPRENIEINRSLSMPEPKRKFSQKFSRIMPRSVQNK